MFLYIFSDFSISTLLVVLSLNLLNEHPVKNKEYLSKNSSVYSLFWNRADYILGLNKTWNNCLNFGISNSYLCESTKNVTQKDVIVLQDIDKLKSEFNNKEEEIIKKKLVKVDLEQLKDENDFINQINEGLVPPESDAIIVLKSEDYELQSKEMINVE
jgi:hypothetical protein